MELVTLCKSYQADVCVLMFFINYTVNVTDHSLILNEAFGYGVVDPSKRRYATFW